jgi:secondary thiamine-phosphate synthase enzyme
MKQRRHDLVVDSSGRGLIEITSAIRSWLGDQDVAQGLLTVFCRHTSASLVIQENADPDVIADIERFFARLVPEDRSLYRHVAEGPDDMPSHIRAALTQSQLSIPIADSAPMLGTWQGIYLFEHRRSPHRRTIVLHLLGE